MSNFDTARDALTTSLESSGSAMKEHAKWSESLEARLLKLKAAWQGLSQSFMNSDFLKVVLDTANALVTVLDKLIDGLGTFGTIGIGFGITGFIKNFSTLKTLAKDVFVALTTNAMDSYDAFTKWSKASNGVVAGGKKLAKSFSAVAGGIGIAVAAIGLLYNAYKNAKEEAAATRQEAIDSSNEFLEASSSFEQAYIKYSGKTSLTAEEENELTTAINGTVDALGDKSSALKDVVNNSNDYLANLEKIKEEELKQAKSAAITKRDNAANQLKEAASNTAMYSGSKLDLIIESGVDLEDNWGEESNIALEVGGKWWDITSRGHEGADDVIKFTLDPDADVDEIVEYYNMLVKYRQELSDNELGDTSTWESVNSKISEISDIVQNYTDAVRQLEKAEYQLDNGIPKTVEEYLAMRKDIIQGIGGDLDTRKEVSNILDEEYGKVFDLTAPEVLSHKLVGLVDAWGWGNKDGTNEIGTVETLLNMRTAVNNNECTVGQYMSQFDKVQSLISGYSDEEKELVNSTFGLDTDKIKEQYDQVVESYMKSFNDSDANFTGAQVYFEEKFLSNLSANELTALVNIEPEIDWKNTSWDDIRKQIEKEAALIEAISFSIDLELETEKLENLTTAVSESISGAGLGTASMSLVEDMFGDLDSYDPTALFEHTANGIRMNSEEFRKLNDEYKKTNIDGLEGKMDALGERYNQTREELSDLTYGSKEYNKKLKELNDIEDQINATEKLASQYRGLASAYQSWQRAESAGSQRDMYEGMIEGFENIDDEISRGWLDDGTIEFLRLIKGENLSATATTKQLKEAYKSLDDTIKNTTYSVRDFFTVDEDGNSTNTGVYNFLDAIGQLEEEEFGGKDVVKRDKNGNIIGFDFKIVGGDEAIADALGISEELVQIMVRAADDAGFVVSMDGTYQQLDTLKDKAQEAADKLKELKITDFNFNINTGSEKSVQDQYKEALDIWAEFKKNKNEDGTINMNVEGAEQAFTLVSTLQSMVDRLSEPTYMELDATQVEKDMQTPLSKLQEYERLTQQENQLKLKGTDTSEIDKSQKAIIDYFEKLKPEVKAELGIKDLSREEIQAKVEAGEIEIPATIDLQVEMNNTLRDMVNVALYNAGVIGKEEFEKRVDVEVYAENVDTSDVDEKTKEEVEKKKAEARKANVEIIADTVGIEDVDALSEKLNGLDDTTVKAIAEVLGQIDVDKLKNTIAHLDNKEVEAIAKAMGQGDVDALKTAISELDPTYVQAIAEAFGYDDVQDLFNAIEKLEPKTVEAVANALGITDVESLKGAIDNVKGKDVEVNATTSGESKLSGLKSIIDSIKSKTVTITSWFKKIVSGGSTRNDSNGFSDVNGTANVNGTTGRAFRQGSWGTKNSGTALGGELGTEILVRDGRWFTIGDGGAEFFQYKKGDIIFNHKQSDELLKYGRVTSGTGRAKAFAEGSKGFGGFGKVIGNALNKFADKVAEKTANKVKNNNSSNSSSSGSKSSGDGSNDVVGKVEGNSVGKDKDKDKDKDEKEFEETFDWVEIKISRIERAIDNLDKKANNVYKSWSSRNNALADEIGKVGEEISIQQAAYNEYIKEANSVGLSESYAKKVRNGTIDIEDFKGEEDEALVEKIKEYQQWYNKALDCQDAIEELRETEASLYAQRFENIQAQYDGILQGYEHTEAMLNEYISQAEAKGHIVSKQYYQVLIDNEKSNIAELKKEQEDLIAERDNAVAEGKITKGSQAWYEQCAAIDEVTQAIEESTTALLEFDNAMRDIDWQIFDLIQERISAVSEEADFLIELMSNDKLFEDDGKLTSQGLATMGLHAQNANTHMYAADTYGEEVAKLDAQIKSDPYDQELINRRNELLELQRECIIAAENEKNAIHDMVEDGINLELDALQELIDKKNEELESEKDLYNYQKKVKEQTSEIASLEKQMVAYSGDDSEEAKAKIQELKVSLEEAETDLQETEWDRYIDQQSQLLDALYTEYELILNTRLDNIDYLLSQVIDSINLAASADGNIATALGSEGAISIAVSNNATSIKDTLTSEAKNVGTTLSSAMNNIWSVGEGNAKSVLTMYGEDFKTKSATIITTLNGIKSSVNSMVASLNKEATKKTAANKTTTSAKKDPIKNSTTVKKPTTTTKKPTSSSGDGKPKVGDKVKFVSGQYYYDSQGKKPLGSKYQGKQVYITKINTAKWATHPYHISTGTKLGKGDLGWLRLNQLSGYATGKQNFLDDEIAWTQEGGKKEFIVRPSDGAILTPVAKGDSILTSAASNNIWNMANNPAEFIKDNLGIGSASVPSAQNVNNNITQHFENITFSLPNVHGYNDLLREMQSDPKFEKLVLSMTVDRIAGRSKLAKGKSIR